VTAHALLDPCEALAQVGLLYGFKPLDPEWATWCTLLHEKQSAVANDTSPNIAVLAGRRAGKTEGCIYWLARDWQSHPGKKSLYVASTIGSAREIIWDRLKDFDEKASIGIEFNESRLEARFPNGYVIHVTGCENKKQANRVARGKRFLRVVIDEMELFEDELVRYFIRSALKPTLMDYGGHIMLMGTPGNALAGFWYEITRADNDNDDEEDEKTARGVRKLTKRWPTHRFNALDNPFIGYPGGAAQYFRDQLEENGWREDDPEFVIEYLGRWVTDSNAYVYPFSEAKNLWDDEDAWDTAGAVRTVIGVDLGNQDGCGFSVVQKRWDSDEIRCLEAYATVNLDTDEIAAEIKTLMRRYKTHHVFVDSKGHGATTIARSLINYGIPAEPAENNHKKLPLIKVLKGVLRNGCFKLHPVRCRELAIELKAMTWDKTRDSHQEGIPDEVIDATLWAVFECRKLAVKAQKEARPKLSAEEFAELQEKLEDLRSERNAERLKRLGNPTHRAKSTPKGRRVSLDTSRRAFRRAG
jgi:hypothetical protein